MSSDLLPENATALQRAVAEKWSRMYAAAEVAPIESLWDAWRCPTAFLPFLAYALSVDFWSDDWDENLKRQVIADSPGYHRLKGTRRAVELAVATLGRPAELVEWHEVFPRRRRGTFEIRIPTETDEDLVQLVESANRMRRLVYAAKPKSRSFSITLTATVEMALTPSCGVFAEDRVVLVVPPDGTETEISPSAGVILHEFVMLGAT